MRKHLVARAHITVSNKLTESEVTALASSTIDETSFGMLKRQESQGIPIVSSQRTFVFDIQDNPY